LSAVHGNLRAVQDWAIHHRGARVSKYWHFDFPLTHVSLEMRTVYKIGKVSAPTVLGVQRHPVGTQRRKGFLIPNYLAVFEEVQVNSASFQVDAVHGL
jgi:hypothetical protein